MVVDYISWYKGSWNPKPLTWEEINKMKKIMRKVPVIKKISDNYHQKEVDKADLEFEQQLENIK